MARFAHVKDNKVVNIFEATPEWATQVYGDEAIPAHDNVHMGDDVLPDKTFQRPPRNVAADAALVRAEIMRLVRRTDWTTDPDSLITPQQRVQWNQWRKDIRNAIKNLTPEELADYFIPTPPGPLDEA